MNGKHGANLERLVARSRQAGGLTIFTAVFVLILMTMMLLYATRVGQFEQRVSANDLRQKTAFQVAEAGIDYGMEYFLAAGGRVLSGSAQAMPDGAGGFRPGWLSTGNVRWTACPATPGLDHPCGGEIPLGGGTGSFYYDDPSTTTTGAYDTIPLDATLLANLPAGTDLRLSAVICPRTLDDATCDAGLVPDPTDPEASPAKYMVWLLAYGYSDCNDDDASGDFDLPGECRGTANVAVPFGTIRNTKGSPTVPLVSKNSIPASGTAEVVPNPDGGGEGVPLSIWANSNGACAPLNPDGSPGDDLTVSGSFKTCEMHEWYGIDNRPADAKCNQPTCACDYPGPEPISYRQGLDEVIGIDVQADPGFPCDLFEFFFGVPRTQYQAIKANFTVINDCSVLNTSSTGSFWFSGDTCTLDDVGGINNPVLLVSAADVKTVINGNTDFYGVMFIANVEDPELDAFFKPGGGATVYGAVIADVLFPQSGYAGTFRIVYNEAGVLNAGGVGGLGGIAGGWHDFGLPDLTWE